MYVKIIFTWFLCLSVAIREKILEMFAILRTTVHLIAGVLTVDHLITAAVVGDAGSVFALELSYFTQSHCKHKQEHLNFCFRTFHTKT